MAVDSSFDYDNAPTIFDPKTLVRKGRCMVSKTRTPTQHELYYEIHGVKDVTATTSSSSAEPPLRRLMFIMGLSNSCFGWNHQVEHFTKHASDKFGPCQVLVFDNRGVGLSDSPKGAYKTSEMAKDAVELLQFVGWIPEDVEGAPSSVPKVNIIGVSMGGMIALELATLIPAHIHSLCLTSTKSGTVREIPRWIVISTFAKLLSGAAATPEKAIPAMTNMLFPQAYLDAPREGTQGLTNRQYHEKNFLERYHLTRRQTMGGRLGQLAAVFTHKVDEKRLAGIARQVPRIAIITGTDDNLVNPSQSQDLHRDMPGSTLTVLQGCGHALPAQVPERYNAWLEEVIMSQPIQS